MWFLKEGRRSWVFSTGGLVQRQTATAVRHLKRPATPLSHGRTQVDSDCFGHGEVLQRSLVVSRGAITASVGASVPARLKTVAVLLVQ